MKHLDYKYICFISSELRNFKWKSDKLANCSCPMCGDSIKDKLKARFYFFGEENHYRVYCHNCHYSSAFGHFLNHINESMYQEYRKETFAEKMRVAVKREKLKPKSEFKNPVFTPEDSPVKRLQRLPDLPEDHPAKIYVNSRLIPKNKQDRIYYTDNYKSWVNSFIPQKFAHVDDPDPRIVFPYMNKEKEFWGSGGRTIIPKREPRYINVSIDHEGKHPNLWGMDRVDFSKRFYVTEGAVDSLFLDNAVAMGTSAIDLSRLDWSNAVFILDNEPRNPEIISCYNRLIDYGVKLCIWPNGIKPKDINEMVKEGIKNIESLIASNVYNGLQAKLKLNEWKKV